MTAGCSWLVPLIFVHPGTKTVPPEFAKLEDRKAVVLVWAEPETLYDYQHIRLELASYVGDEIRAGVKGVQLVNERKVEDYLQRTPEAAVAPRMVGDHFGAEMVVYVELLEFQIRDPESPDLLQGRARAAVRVHDMTVDADEMAYHELAEVSVVYPERSVLYTMTAPEVIRNETYKQFAELVGRKFYEHQEKL
jgi:hypothetical protein